MAYAKRADAHPMRFLIAAGCLLLLLPAAAAVVLEDQDSSGHHVMVAEVSLPDGGFVVIHDARLLDGDAVGSVVGVSSFFEPGRYTDVAVRLVGLPAGDVTLIAMPHRDTDQDETYDFVSSGGLQDGPYVDAGPIMDAASVSVQADLVFAQQKSADGQIRIARAWLPEGGFVTIHDEGLADGEAVQSVVGTSGYLPPGVHRDLYIDVHGTGMLTAMAHQDTDGDRTYDFVLTDGADDGPYQDANGPITTTAEVSARPADAEGTVSRTVRAAPGDEDTPGFPAVMVLLAAGLIALRRR